MDEHVDKERENFKEMLKLVSLEISYFRQGLIDTVTANTVLEQHPGTYDETLNILVKRYKVAENSPYVDNYDETSNAIRDPYKSLSREQFQKLRHSLGLN